MQHDVTQPTPPFRSASGALEIHQIPAWKDNLIWLAVCTKTGAAAAIDGPDAGGLLTYCDEHAISLKHVFNTHTHADHVGLNRDLASRDLLEGLEVVGAAKTSSAIPGLTRGVEDGDALQIGDVAGRAMLTEGHLDGHLAYVFDDVVFSGDAMFCGGCGYLFDGPAEKMHDSLERLAALDPATRVCCAHEYTQDNLQFAWTVESDNTALADRIRRAWSVRATGGCTVPSTIGLERDTNPFLRHHSATVQAALAEAWPERDLSTPALRFAATRALKDRKDYKSLTEADLPL